MVSKECLMRKVLTLNEKGRFTAKECELYLENLKIYSAMKELQEKIDYFKEKIQNLDNFQKLPSDVHF